MEKNLDYYMNLPYRIMVVPDEEGDGYVLHCPELTGCITCAETLEQGLEMINDAKMCWFDACLEEGIPIPEPGHLDDYSGQFKLRIPKSLHKALAERSRQEGVSMNQYCSYLLSAGVNSSPGRKVAI